MDAEIQELLTNSNCVGSKDDSALPNKCPQVHLRWGGKDPGWGSAPFRKKSQVIKGLMSKGQGEPEKGWPELSQLVGMWATVALESQNAVTAQVYTSLPASGPRKFKRSDQ